MKTYSGPFLTEEGFVQGEIRVEYQEIVEYEEGGDGGEDAIIIPSLFNAHTHVGDSVFQEVPEGSLEKVVGPGGVKQEVLSQTKAEKKKQAMKGYFSDMVNSGVFDFIDFRERGVEGVNVLKEALSEFESETGIRPRIMSRPPGEKYDSWELNKILSLSDGVGLSSYRDWDDSQIKRISEETKKKGKPFSLHCSEAEREPIADVLDLSVHHLVHMLEATKEDLELCAEKDVPIVLCPRSNLYFRKFPDIPKMVDAGVDLCLGTDNAMLCSPNMLREMETAYRVARMNGGIDAEEVLMMATWNPRKYLNLSSDLEGEQDEVTDYLILRHREGNPAYNVVTKTNVYDILQTVRKPK